MSIVAAFVLRKVDQVWGHWHSCPPSRVRQAGEEIDLQSVRGTHRVWNSNNLPIYVPALDEVKELREELVLFFGRADV